MNEIAETAALHEIDESIAFVDSLKELGCSVAIDEFGAGYSTFRNLQLLDIDVVKIDGSIVKNIIESPDDPAFVRTLVKPSNVFGLKTVAEWVSGDTAAALLEEAAVTYMQGNFFGMPKLTRRTNPRPNGACQLTENRGIQFAIAL